MNVFVCIDWRRDSDMFCLPEGEASSGRMVDGCVGMRAVWLASTSSGLNRHCQC